MPEPVTVTEHDGVAVVRIAHGPVNALDLELLAALRTTFERLTDARAVVLTGNGRAFSAGVDLRRLLADGPTYAVDFLPALSDALLAVFTHPRPVVAAIDGHAIAGGAILALACDHRLMSAGRIGVPELAVGVPFPTVAVEILRHAWGSRFQARILGRGTVTVDEAVQEGLVDEACPPEDLLDAAVARALALAAVPRVTFAITKRQLLAPALARIAVDRPVIDPEVLDAWCAPDIRAGIASYLDALATRAR